MKYRWLGGPALALLSLTAVPAQAKPFDGVHVGAGATLDNFNRSGPAKGGAVPGVGATFLLGYDLSFGDQGFVGVEANGDVSTADAVGIAARYGIGVSARAGFMAGDHVGVYLRAGYQRDRVVLVGIGDWVPALRLGGGAEFAVTEHLSVRAEYDHLNMMRHLANDQAVVALIYSF